MKIVLTFADMAKLNLTGKCGELTDHLAFAGGQVRQWCVRAVGVSVIALTLLVCLGEGAQAVDNLSSWTGLNNVTGANNYTATSTTAGGTFQARFDGAYLADLALAVPGGALTNSQPFSATGTLTFDNPNLADLDIQFGFFDQNSLGGFAYGLGFGDQPANEFRIQTSTGNDNGNGGGGDPLPAGTYPFSIAYDPATAGGQLTATVGTASQTATSLNDDADDARLFNAFGFFQRSRGQDDPNTYTFNVSNIEYTGGTVIPEPASAALWLLGVTGLLVRRHRRPLPISNQRS